MPYARIMVPLTADDRTALLKRAEEECRDPREHLRYLLRQDAEQRGMMDNGMEHKTKVAPGKTIPPRNDQDSGLDS